MNTKLCKDMAQASIAGSLKFPEIVGKLIAEGMESYHVDFVRSENRYYMPNGESHVEPVDLEHAKAAQKFSATQVEAAVRKSQAGKINYPQFVKEVLDAGCVYYITYLTGKRVTYFGREGDSHTEFFPGSR